MTKSVLKLKTFFSGLQSFHGPLYHSLEVVLLFGKFVRWHPTFISDGDVPSLEEVLKLVVTTSILLVVAQLFTLYLNRALNRHVPVPIADEVRPVPLYAKECLPEEEGIDILSRGDSRKQLHLLSNRG